jgi:hypothetical protein
MEGRGPAGARSSAGSPAASFATTSATDMVGRMVIWSLTGREEEALETRSRGPGRPVLYRRDWAGAGAAGVGTVGLGEGSATTTMVRGGSGEEREDPCRERTVSAGAASSGSEMTEAGRGGGDLRELLRRVAVWAAGAWTAGDVTARAAPENDRRTSDALAGVAPALDGDGGASSASSAMVFGSVKSTREEGRGASSAPAAPSLGIIGVISCVSVSVASVGACPETGRLAK